MAVYHLSLGACLSFLAAIRKWQFSFLRLFSLLEEATGNNHLLRCMRWTRNLLRSTPASWKLSALEGMNPQRGLSGCVLFSKHRVSLVNVGTQTRGSFSGTHEPEGSFRGVFEFIWAIAFLPIPTLAEAKAGHFNQKGKLGRYRKGGCCQDWWAA